MSVHEVRPHLALGVAGAPGRLDNNRTRGSQQVTSAKALV